MNIEIAQIWLLLESQVHQDFLLVYPDLMTGLTAIIESMSMAQKLELQAFLQDVSAADLSRGELLDLWRKSGSEYLILEKSKIDGFYSELLRAVQQSLKSDG